MMDFRWERIRSILGRSLELEGLARDTYLDEACGDDRELRDEVERLLGATLEDDFLVPPGEVEVDVSSQLTLGDFEIQQELGRGGMGVVYLAYQRSLARQVAVKVLVTRLTTTAKEVSRFHREARAAARLQHPGIVQVFSEGCSDNVHWFAMEYVPGHDLRTEIELQRHWRPGNEGLADARRPFLPLFGQPGHARRVAEVGASVADALHFAHQRGLIHRDVKPQNLLLQPGGRIQVTDFGLVRDEALIGLTSTGELPGTPHYMSPEQANAVRNVVDHRTDVYSLGVVLYELATLVRPYEGSTSEELFTSIRRADPRPITHVNRTFPKDLATICGKAMARDPRSRYATAKELADDLRRFLAGESIVARPPLLLERVARKVERHRLAATGAAVMLAGLGGGSWWTTRSAHAASMARVTLGAFDPSGAPVRGSLGYRTLDPILGTPGALVSLGVLPFTGRLPQGYHRLVVQLETGGSREIVRLADSAQELDLQLTIEDGPDLSEGMVLIPGGTLHLTEDSVQPVPFNGTPIVLEPFLMDVHEVSNREYRAFLTATGHPAPVEWERVVEGTHDDLPVVRVGWEDARAYAEWAGKRLPSLAEWIWAARGEAHRRFPWGDEDPLRANVNRRHGLDGASGFDAYLAFAAPVDSFPEARSPQGVYHLFGNVIEWTESLLVEPTPEGLDPRPARRFVAGGYWNAAERDLTNAHGHQGPERAYATPRLGFRCVRSISM